MNHHATTIAWQGIGIILTGPPGCGKSTLAHKLIQRGAMLVADDQTLLHQHQGTWIANCPTELNGLLHLRDHGFIEIPTTENIPVSLIIQSNQSASRLSQAPNLEGIQVLTVDFHDPHCVDFICQKAISSFAF